MSEATQQTVDQPTQSAGDVQETPQEKTFTQEEVNGYVAKETKKAQEKLLRGLGIEDFDSAKEGLAKFREWQEAQKTEAEKQAEKMAETESALGLVRAENGQLKAQLSALKQGVNADAVEDVIALAEKQVTDEVTIDQAIQNILVKYPQFGKQIETAEVKTPTITVGGSPQISGQTVDMTGMTYAERLALKQSNPALFEQYK